MSIQAGYYLCTFMGIMAGILMTWLALRGGDDE